MINRTLSYRGLLADGGQDTILLSTKKGEVGYRIVKFAIMPEKPGGDTIEAVVKIYTVEPSAVDAVVDFSSNTLLAAAYFADSAGSQNGFETAIIFDNMTFNQDIYVTNKDANGSKPVNYYLELEVIKLSEDQAMVATLKDIRNND